MRLRSVNSIVMPAAKTGRERSSRIAVIRTDQTNNGFDTGIWRGLHVDNGGNEVDSPRIEETPARWREKITKSTEAPG